MKYVGPSDADRVLDAALDEFQLPFRCPFHGSRPFKIACNPGGEIHGIYCDVEYGCGCKRHRTAYELRTTTAF